MNVEYIGSEYAMNYVKPRREDMHKGECGRVLIIAGSLGMAGAAVLCGRAALRAGAGLVTMAVPEELFSILQISVPEAMCIQRSELLDDHKDSYLQQFDAIAIGPGLRVSEENMNIIRHVIQQTTCPIIIDADGINTICRCDNKFTITSLCAERFVFTPHTGEADRILKCFDLGTVKDLGREQAARKLADVTGSVILLKGSGTLITRPDDRITCNMSGNPGMATGGSGDVLTGIIVALAGYGYEEVVAARTGAYVHGLAGDLAAKNIGQWGMTAQNIVDFLPEALKSLAGC